MINNTVEFKVVGYKTVHTAKMGDMIVLSGTYADPFVTGSQVGTLWLSDEHKQAFEAIQDSKKLGSIAVCRCGYNKNGQWTLFLDKFKL